MARPIEYDRDQVLEGVMKTFWEKGYEGTSISDLVRATQLNTRTMYNVFGNKQGLYLAALKNYQNQHLQNGLALLKRKHGIAGVSDFLNAMTESEPINSCLFVNSLSEECGSIGDPCREYVQNYFGLLEQQIKKNLKEAKEDGEFAGNATVAAQALVCLLQGMCLSKLHPSTEEQRRMVRYVLRTIIIGSG